VGKTGKQATGRNTSLAWHREQAASFPSSSGKASHESFGQTAFCSTFHVSRQAAETDKQDAQTGDRDAKTVWQACEPARPIQAEGSMCCALGFTDPARGTSNVFRLVRVCQGFKLPRSKLSATNNSQGDESEQ
jgi:hypothetical protein